MCYTKTIDVLPEDGSVRSEPRRRLMFLKYDFESHESYVLLLVKTLEFQRYVSHMFSTIHLYNELQNMPWF